MASERRRAVPAGFDAQAAFRQAGEAFAAGQLARAEALLKEVLHAQPTSRECWNNLGFVRHLQGRDEEALDCYRRVLALDPRHAGARFNLAKSLEALRRSGEAQAHLSELLAHHPAKVEALNELANLHHAAGRVQAAEHCYRKALTHAPRYAPALRNLGELLRAAGAFEEAARMLRRYLALEAGDARAWLSLGEALLGAGARDDASAALQQAAELAEDVTEFWKRLGQAWARTANWRGALHAYSRALGGAPHDIAVVSGLAKAYLDGGEPDAAERTLRDALAQSQAPVQKAELLNLLGVVRLGAQDVAGAGEAFGESLNAAPRSAVAQSNLGVVLGARGRRDEAQAAWRRAIELDADCGEAYRHWAHSVRCESLRDALPRAIAAALQRDVPDEARMQLHFAMGKQCDDCAQHDLAFEHYARANALHSQRFPFDLAAWQRHVERIRAVFDRDYFAALAPPPNAASQPVFVVGMPRSGTTLLEQIIARHSQGAGRSELRKIEQLVFRLESGGAAYPECVPALNAAQRAQLAGDYLAELRRGEAADAARIVDKMPFNFMHLGLIATLFANARIVHCRRDPLDTCLSNFFQLFPAGAGFAYDLATLGHYYRAYESLMQHWDEVLPRRALTVCYETFVREPEAQARRLLDYLALPWEADCLNFHDRPRDVQTLSAWQVREPLHTGSVGRWRHYAAHLAPLRDALQKS